MALTGAEQRVVAVPKMSAALPGPCPQLGQYVDKAVDTATAPISDGEVPAEEKMLWLRILLASMACSPAGLDRQWPGRCEHRMGPGPDQLTRGGQPIMSVIVQRAAPRGTRLGLRIVAENGDEIDYLSGRDLTMAIEDSSIFTEGHGEGAVLATLSIDYLSAQNRIQVDSPRGHSDLVTIERTIALLTVVRDALRMTQAQG